MGGALLAGWRLAGAFARRRPDHPRSAARAGGAGGGGGGAALNPPDARARRPREPCSWRSSRRSGARRPAEYAPLLAAGRGDRLDRRRRRAPTPSPRPSAAGRWRGSCRPRPWPSARATASLYAADPSGPRSRPRPVRAARPRWSISRRGPDARGHRRFRLGPGLSLRLHRGAGGGGRGRRAAAEAAARLARATITGAAALLARPRRGPRRTAPPGDLARRHHRGGARRC